MKKLYKTNNYEIFYIEDHYKIKNISIEIELLRRHYYNLLLEFFIKHVDLKLSDKKMSEIFAYFIIHNAKNNIMDPILSNKPIFKINYIQGMVKSNVENFGPKEKIELKKVLLQLDTLMIKYYNTFMKLIPVVKKNVEIIKEHKNDLIILSLKDQNLSFSIHISLYKHLLKNYSIRNYNIYENITQDVSWINEFDERIFILFCRYNYLFSGSTQASIQPQLKKRLLEMLNIKIELFASGINSSYTTYCSLFYDIEKYFGSLGSFFKTEIKAGYYEINPPFEKDIIDNMFNKLYSELNLAEKNKRPLLFFIIIPQINLMNIKYYNKMSNFLKFKKKFDKSEFLYMYYDETFSYAITRNIIDTYILIYHTSFIKEAVKKNVTKVI